MMLKPRNIILIWIPVCFLAGCIKESPSQKPITSFDQLFETFWDQMNTNYVYWDIDTTNWNRAHDTYKPLFSQLDLHDSADILRSLLYFRQMTIGLIDGHFQILFTMAPLAGTNLYPAAIRKEAASDFHLPGNYPEVDLHYFDTVYGIAFDSLTQIATGTLRITLATLNRNILYFSCNGFALQRSYDQRPLGPVASLLDSFFAIIDHPSLSTKGLIIDVRNNYGGDLADLDFLMGHFIHQPLQIGYSSYKRSASPLDFTPWISASLSSGADLPWQLPLIVLTDHYTVSLAEAVAMTAHLIPKGMTLGETTWGATGPSAAHDLYNDGSFSIPGFLNVNMSSARFKYIDDQWYEGKGFPPDISVPFNPVSLAQGKDPALEKAISQIQP
jgi:carboxyl-terminal processing protease